MNENAYLPIWYLYNYGCFDRITPLMWLLSENENGDGGDDGGFSNEYLAFEALEDTTFTFTTNALQYSLDGGTTWTTLAADTATPTVSAGNKILWKQTGLAPNSEVGIGIFSATGNFNVSGNIMSLYYGDNFVGQTNLTGKDYAFYGLFNGCNQLVNAENLILPATTLTEGCYSGMFLSCTSLTSAPTILPATTLAESCYSGMFLSCTSLTSAPTILPATTLAESCYQYMFYACTSLTTAPELPATTLAGSCYSFMFSSCTSLTKAPELPATTLAGSCYTSMFEGCTSLTSAPEILPAIILANLCYSDMFSNCTSLTTAPTILPATTLTVYCYKDMFQNCTSLTTAPILPATTLTEYCYSGMFNDCSSLNYIKCLATNISASNCTANWVQNVSASGTFVKTDSMSSWTTGIDGIPSGWTTQDA